MRSGYEAAQLRAGQQPATLCTITMPSGEILRLSDRRVEVTTTRSPSTGPYQYRPLLSGLDAFSEEIDYSGAAGVSSLTQATVELTTTVDLAAQLGDWMHLAAARVELAEAADGQPWEAREVLLDARVAAIEIGLAGEVTRLSVESAAPVASALVGDDSRDLGDDWAGAQDNGGSGSVLDMTDLTGSKYQWVYGDPESVPIYKVGEIGGSGSNSGVLAGHYFARSGVSYLIQIFEDGVAAGAATVEHDTVNGKPYARIDDVNDLYGSAAGSGSGGGAYTYSAVHGGLAAADQSTGPAIGAGAVLALLLQQSGARVDWRRMQPALQRLASWRVGFYTDSAAPALQLLRDRLLPWLPLVELQSGAGLWYAYVDPVHDPVVADLVAGQQLVGRIGGISTTDLDQIRNRFTIRYWLDAGTGEYAETVTVDADTDALCYLSKQLYGELADDSLDCDVVWDAQTARRILKTRAGRLALPRRVVAYQVAADVRWLRAGQVVRITDSARGISATRGLVTSITRSAPYEATIELLDRSPQSR